MKRIIETIALVLLAFVLAPTVSAAEYGVHPERAKTRYVVSQGRKLNVREKPYASAKLVTQLKPGDVVYVENYETTNANGYEWLKITDNFGKRLPSDAYVTFLNRLVPEDNPSYVAVDESELQMEKTVESSQTVVKWILLILSILLAIGFIYVYFEENGKEKLIGEEEDGMRRTFFFNIAPYRSVLIVTGLLFCAVVASVAALMLLGGVGFILLWVVKILALAIMWIGIICCVLCIIATVCGAFVALIGVAIGGFIWYHDDKIEAFADACSETGLKFFHELNVFGFTYDLIADNWQTIVMWICAPLALFLALAAVWLITAGLLIGYERFVTARYNIKHPCPHCQQPSEPAIYLSRGEEGYEEIPNDIRLRPGMYGLFHITHPYTGERMPTMLMNGRDQMARYCGNCGHRINAEEGTEKHIALVGTAQSGKSTLSYRLMAEIFNRAGEDRVEFTDYSNSTGETWMINCIRTIGKKGRIDEEDLPKKTATDQTRSLQLIIKPKHRPVPYRLFINDVAGELFDVEHKDQRKDKTRFFRNVDTIIMMLDPLTTDFADCDPSDVYTTWLTKYDTAGAVKLRIRDLQDTVMEQIREHNNNPKKIHLNLVLPKKDLGYIPSDIDIHDQEQLKSYMREEMGLGDLLHWANDFASLTVIAVGAMETGTDSNIAPVVDKVIVEQLDIKL